jgi:hypothetical protein
VNRSTAILLFTRAAEEEAKRKQWSARRGKSTNVSIAQTLIARTIREVRRTGLPFYVISSDHQQGTLFADRLMHAIAQVFDQGYEKVIAIGNDSPQLQVPHLLEAARSLEAHPVVLGPDYRGGAYLIGLSKKVFDAAALKELRWNSALLYNDFVSWCRRQSISFTSLESLSDLNDAADFRRLLSARKIPLSLLRLFQSLLSSFVQNANAGLTSYYPAASFTTPLHRGPPRLA